MDNGAQRHDHLPPLEQLTPPTELMNVLTHSGRVTQICVFTLQLRKTDDANLRF